MRRFILTGAPGAGKTVLLRRLEIAGCAVVEEAATDVIAMATALGVHEPWRDPAFADDIASLQIARQRRADALPDEVVIFDRSPVCTLALCEFLDLPAPPRLTSELARIERERVYERQVFFVELLGFVTPTEARRITLEDSRRFAEAHRDVYRRLGFELVPIAPADLDTRCATILARLG